MWARQVLINVTKAAKNTLVSKGKVNSYDGKPNFAT